MAPRTENTVHLNALNEKRRTPTCRANECLTDTTHTARLTCDFDLSSDWSGARADRTIDVVCNIHHLWISSNANSSGNPSAVTTARTLSSTSSLDVKSLERITSTHAVTACAEEGSSTASFSSTSNHRRVSL